MNTPRRLVRLAIAIAAAQILSATSIFAYAAVAERAAQGGAAAQRAAITALSRVVASRSCLARAQADVCISGDFR
jgi:hypothetical protein